MCGIAGVFAYRRRFDDSDRERVDRMCLRMRPRGPDGHQLWSAPDQRVVLGHRRLAVIDLAPTGAQPMRSDDGTCVITFNGEIYNYRELRAELEGQGYRFRSQSDTEVLLHLYAQLGEGMLHRLRGMFAFALWDQSRQGLFCARDPFGIKPLYYADDGNALTFASEVKALLAAGDVDRRPEPAGHVGFFLWGHVPEPYTLYRGIRSLPAGSMVWTDARGVGTIRHFAHLPAELAAAERSAPVRRDEAVRELRDALRDSVRHHLVADVDTGVFLSAGLDSTTIAGLAAEERTGLRTITLGFEEFRGTHQDETPFAAGMAQRFGTNHETIWITRQQFGGELERLMDRMDQPSTDGVNTYFVARAAATAGLKVMLSGIGGDELFGGYPSFRDVPRLVRLAGAIPLSRAVGLVIRRTSAALLSAFLSPKYASVVELGGDYASAYLLRRSVYLPWELPLVLDAEVVQAGLNELRTSARLSATVEGIENPHLRVSALEASWYMRNQLLRDTDWAGMSHSVEVRTPLVDWALWKRVLPLLRQLSGEGKQVMAAALSAPLPKAVLTRAKTGFAIPTRQWLIDMHGPQHAQRGLRGWAQFIHGQFGGAELRPSPQRRGWVVGETGTVRESPTVGARRFSDVGTLVRPVRSDTLAGELREAGIRFASRVLSRGMAHPTDLARIDKILVLQLQQLGDSVVFTPALRALRLAYPRARIDLLVNRVGEQLYRKCPHVNRLFVDESSLGHRWDAAAIARVLRAVRRERYDAALADVTQRSLWYATIAFLTGARDRVGFDENARGFLFSTRIPYDPKVSIIECNLQLVGALGAARSSEAVECYFDADDEAHADDLLKGIGGDPVVAIHPASNWQSKTWVPERWAATADALVERVGASVVFVGGARDRPLVASIVAQMRRSARNVAGHTTLSQLSALLARCDLVVGTDSGPRHLAAATGRKTVTLMSSQDYRERWTFFREHEILLRIDPPCSPCFKSWCSHVSCMTGITTEAVVNACERLLAPVATPVEV